MAHCRFSVDASVFSRTIPFLSNRILYITQYKNKGLNEEAKEAEEAIASMEKTVLDAGWDGEWFLRAYDHYKQKIGSKECEDGKIFIEPQGFCVMEEISPSSTWYL